MPKSAAVQPFWAGSSYNALAIEMTAEQALKENLISVEDLDKWNIDYYKTAKEN